MIDGKYSTYFYSPAFQMLLEANHFPDLNMIVFNLNYNRIKDGGGLMSSYNHKRLVFWDSQ
jgi:hypothetical protein